jgi:hypothetical protein
LSSALAELREEEYLRRLEVTRLRRLVYEQSGPAPDELMEELSHAEQALWEAEQARAQAQSEDSTTGVVLDTREKTQNLGVETTELEAAVHLRMEYMPTAIAHLLEPAKNPLLSCWVRNARRNATRRLRVTAFVEGYSASAVETFELKGSQDHTFDLLPILYPEKVRNLNEMTRATLNVLLEDLEVTSKSPIELHRSHAIWLLPRTSAPLFVSDPTTGGWLDMTPYLGAFVTPNAPEVMTFLRKVADYHPKQQLPGYQGSKAAVEPQVKAIYDALKTEAKIRYVNSVLTSSPDEGFADQRVRLPRESLTDCEANCIDGTVLVASLLEAISMSPAIVVVPGHAFVAWETWKKSDEWQYLETTMIGDHSFEEAHADAERKATFYSGRAAQDKFAFRRWPLRTLRSDRRITPME